jgi:hypothetical protein
MFDYRPEVMKTGRLLAATSAIIAKPQNSPASIDRLRNSNARQIQPPAAQTHNKTPTTFLSAV